MPEEQNKNVKEPMKLGEEKELSPEKDYKTHRVIGYINGERRVLGFAYPSKNKEKQINIVIYFNGTKTDWFIKPSSSKKNDKSPDYVSVLRTQRIIGYNKKNNTIKLIINLDGKAAQVFYLIPLNQPVNKAPKNQSKLGG